MSTLGDEADVKFGNFGKFPRHRTLSYSLSTPCFVTTAPPRGKTCSTPGCLVHKKETGRDSLPLDMLLSAVSVLVIVQLSSEFQRDL